MRHTIQVVNRLVGAISAVLWLPFSQRFGTRASYFVSISIGVAASCVILLPMTAHLFWLVPNQSCRVSVFFLSFHSLFNLHCIRFLSALLALTGTGNFIFARVLLSELTSVQHASVTCAPQQAALICFASVFPSAFHSDTL